MPRGNETHRRHETGTAVRSHVLRRATWHDEIEQVPLAERCMQRPQPVFLHARELGEAERESCIVAEGAEITDVIGRYARLRAQGHAATLHAAARL